MLKAHTFNGVSYRIEIVKRIDGVTDVPGMTRRAECHILLVTGQELHHLDNAIHEGLEALGAPDALLHDANGESRTGDLARFLWRLGYRKCK